MVWIKKDEKGSTLPLIKMKSASPRNTTTRGANGKSPFQSKQASVSIFLGPVRGGMGDKEMLTESGVLGLLKNRKLAIVDRGYINKDNRHKLSWPNPHDSKAVNNFKARARLRHEAFNGRMCFFDILSHEF